MKRIIIIYGLIAGVVTGGTLLVSMLFYQNGNFSFSSGAVIGYTSMVIALSLIYFGVRQFRDKHHDGRISFGKALLMGLLISLVASIVYSLAWEICYSTVAKDFMSTYTEQMLSDLKQSGISEADLAIKTKEMAEMSEDYKNPLVRFPMTMMELLPVGILISLICAFILKRK